MGKKRERDEGKPADDVADKMDEDSSDDEDFDVVNVDFEWFNFDPEIDFQGTKTLLRQLLDVDSTLFNISGLADLILSQPTIGSTVKVDGKENDAYALMTALNVKEHAQKPEMADLARYLIQKAQTSDALAAIPGVLNGEGGAQVGLVVGERLINMPSEIAPPMYRMLIDEIEAAVEDKEPYEFSHYLILSKTYQEVASTLTETERKGKKAKADKASPAMWHFHPEDEVFVKHALAHGAFSYTNDDKAVADSKRAFQEMGVKSHGYMILIEASKWEGAVKAVEQYLSPPQ
ncbi:Protein BCP1 [Colletotrichum orbiculare MAFF 240422]|uniref:Protein BCP1 n=1 Tax=Colletotrichum orbiculare (strain 104-T / ATCC 96160 / CBS 514.97 / LARS 414 / MAFF 240422) TaxID=1213857 RepID=N4W349_COLOR|nr:Protein BCP1 [Colletotrichum orbiculare MAFF 240422]